MSVSLKRIAREADVSVTTVSRVLRGRGEISDETRQRVQKIADKLRYRPNIAAQSIFTGRTNSIGVIIPAATTFDVRIAFGIHDMLAEQDVVPITLWTCQENEPSNLRHSIDNVMKQIHHLVDRRVDGVILRPHNDFRDVYIREILDRHIPLVTVDRDYLGSHADFVGTNDVHGARLVAQHLLGLGHRRIVHLAGPETVMTSQLRKDAFESALASIPDVEYRTIVDESYGLDGQAAMRIFDLKPRPTAIFAANDKMAKFVYNAARRYGLQIPEDLSVVGFADMEIAELMDPPLTTVRQQPYEIGRQAARIMLERIDGKLHEPKSILLEPQLIVRGSTMRYSVQ